MSEIAKIRSSNDQRYDELFQHLQISILAKEAIVASGLSCFDVQTLWTNDRQAAEDNLGYERWLELYWAPKPPIIPTEISTDRALETFENSDAMREGPLLQPEPARVLAHAHVTATIFSVENAA